MEQEFLLLIDGSSLLTTQFYGNLPREILFAKTIEEKEKNYHKIMMTKNGVYTNAVFGFLRTLFQIFKNQQPKYMAVAWDLSRDTFRKEMYPDYKGNRDETPEPLKAQYALMQQLLKRMGICQLMDEHYEADDFCGSAAKKFEERIPVRIFTKDHDYLQLVNDRTHMWLMHTSSEKTEEMYKKYHIDRASVNVPDRAFELDPALVLAEFEVEPAHVNSLKGLQGDSSDNIKGVPGIGPKTAIALIKEYGTVDALYQAISEKTEGELKVYWKEKLGLSRSPYGFLTKTSETELVGEKAARLSEKLATIKTDIDLQNLELEDLLAKPDPAETEKILSELEMRSLSADFMKISEETEDLGTRFRELADFSAFPAYIQNLGKSETVGLSYAPGVGMAYADQDGNAVFVPEVFFFTPEVFRDSVKALKEAGCALFTDSGKEIVKLSETVLSDIQLAAYLLDPLTGDYPPAELIRLYVGDKKIPDQKETKNRLLSGAYAAAMAGPVLLRKLEEKGMRPLYENIELPAMRVLSHMEERGIRVKKEALAAFSSLLQKDIEKLEEEIYDRTGERFNINSPKQLGEILFEKLKLPYGKKTKSGYSTAAEILEKLSDESPVVAKILEYRTLTKLRSTYAEGLQSCIAEDGRIHGTFNQTVTATGRISSTNPNLQNIPVRLELGRELRKVFVPKEGCVFIDADYSQIELRVLAHLSDDENLIEAYRSARDIHAKTASEVFGVPLEEVTPLMRRNAKAVNFGIVYGISAFSLAGDLNLTRKQAQAYMDQYFATYPGIEAFLKKQVEDAKKNGFVRTLYGRLRPIPELNSANFNQRSFGERVAMNSPIQGTAADIMKIAMIRVEDALIKEGLKACIVLQVHDELIIEAPKEEADRVMELLVREMSGAADLKVPLDVEAKKGDSWYETK